MQNCPLALLLTFAATLTGGLHAAVIRGAVVENQTGRPLVRSLVTIQPVAGTAGSTLSARTNVYGAFEFPVVPAGAYLITASRRNFATAQYGQRRYKSAGVPVVVEDNGGATVSIRLQRFGAITGTVVDENDVGIADHEVLAYRNTRPPQLITKATTDDRGAYRLWGLEPGSYLVRTAAKKHDEDSYLPTFSRETSRLDEARPVDVALDQQTDSINVRPFPGRLYTVSGQAYAQTQVTLTLVSDTGTETTVSDSSGNFQFNPVAPGQYELYAAAQPDRRNNGPQAAFLPVSVDRERTDVRVRLGALADLQVTVEDTKGQPVDASLFQLRARRKDFAGEYPAESLRLRQGHGTLMPGRWDLALEATGSYYVAAFAGPQSESRIRADGWNEVVAANGPLPVKFVLSPNPGVVRGVVTGASREIIAGAPVFLEAYDPVTRRRLTDLRITRTDLQGKFQFYGLPPGDYRILSTFEFESPDPLAMDAAGARALRVDEARDVAQDLEIFILR